MAVINKNSLDLGQSLIKILEDYHVEYVFGIPGSHTLPFFNALSQSEQIRHVLTKHESSAAFMALSFTRLTGKLAVCIGTVGPGATNLITGVAEAYRACVPMIVLTVQTPLAFFGKNAFQECSGSNNSIDQIKLLSCVTKKSVLVTDPENMKLQVNECIRVALQGRRGPVHICVPADLFRSSVHDSDDEELKCSHSLPQVSVKKINKCLDFICNAKRVAFIIGARCCFPNVSQELKRIGGEIGIPMITTLAAKGMVDESEHYALGTLDIFAHKIADRYLRECDVVISFGEDFGEYSTIYWDPELLPRNGLVQIDVDKSEFNRNYPSALTIVGELGRVLNEIYEGLKLRKYSNFASLEKIQSMKKNLLFYDEEESKVETIPMKPQFVFAELRKAIPSYSKIFVDVGAHGWWAARYFKAFKDSYFTYYGQMSMGCAVTGVIGAAFADPEEKMICVCGDGCFLMNGLEINTATNYGLDIVWIIFNDNRLNAIDIAQKITYGNLRKYCAMKNPDFSKLADALGIRYLRVDKPSDIRDEFAQLLQVKGPAIVDIFYDDEELLPIKPRAVLSIKDLGLVDTMKDGPYAAKAFSKILKER